MNFPFVRRVVFAVASLAVSTSVLMAPSSAAAASVPVKQGAAEDVQVRGVQPDLEVTPLPMVLVDQKVWYTWKVSNIGGGPAKGIKVTTTAKVLIWSDGSCCNKPDPGSTYMYHTDVPAGSGFLIVLECPAFGYVNYCDNAHAKVQVTQGIPESITFNNGYPQGSTKSLQD